MSFFLTFQFWSPQCKRAFVWKNITLVHCCSNCVKLLLRNRCCKIINFGSIIMSYQCFVIPCVNMIFIVLSLFCSLLAVGKEGVLEYFILMYSLLLWYACPTHKGRTSFFPPNFTWTVNRCIYFPVSHLVSKNIMKISRTIILSAVLDGHETCLSQKGKNISWRYI